MQRTAAGTVSAVKAHAVGPSTRWESIKGSAANNLSREPWNKGKIVGQKAPFKVKEIWALRVRLQMENRVRELALFNLGIDGKLRGRDLVALKVRDVCHGDAVASRAVVMQHKTQRPVQFETTPVTCNAVRLLGATHTTIALHEADICDWQAGVLLKFCWSLMPGGSCSSALEGWKARMSAAKRTWACPCTRPRWACPAC